MNILSSQSIYSFPAQDFLPVLGTPVAEPEGSAPQTAGSRDFFSPGSTQLPRDTYEPLGQDATSTGQIPPGDSTQPNTAKKAAPATANGKNPKTAGTLTDDQKQILAKLAARDTHVRSHEAAHMAAGGAYVRGGASFTYEQGPDGKGYAVGGEVQIDVSPVKGDPKATISKMQQVRAAAMAPADPSGADQAVAASASQTEAAARAELSAQSTSGSQKKPAPSTASQSPAPKAGYTASGKPQNPVHTKSSIQFTA